MESAAPVAPPSASVELDDEDFGDVFKGGEPVAKVERVEGTLMVYRELVDIWE